MLSGRAGVLFALPPALVLNGAALPVRRIVRYAPAQEFYTRAAAGSLSWAAMGLPVEDLAAAGAALADQDLTRGFARRDGPSPVFPPQPTPGADAERRPITVMFCDLVGSTGLAARLDAEDWRNLVGSYLDEASAAVTGLGGHVLKKLGDGLMALFGYPQAQENDAERAVRASLAIQRALAELNARNAGRGAPQLIARIGLESGQVVVDATGEVSARRPMPPRACSPSRNRARSLSPQAFSARSRGCSSPKTAARMRSRACRPR